MANPGDFFNFLFLNYFIETNSNLMRGQFMELANSVLGIDEINIAFSHFSLPSVPENYDILWERGWFFSIVLLQQKVILCSKVLIYLQCNEVYQFFFQPAVYCICHKQIKRFKKTPFLEIHI